MKLKDILGTEEYLKAVDDLLDGYDAYYIINKYGEEDKNTHSSQFKLLYEYLKNDEMAVKALNWIKNNYDCWYKDVYEKDTRSPFYFIKIAINKKISNEGVSNES